MEQKVVIHRSFGINSLHRVLGQTIEMYFIKLTVNKTIEPALKWQNFKVYQILSPA